MFQTEKTSRTGFTVRWQYFIIILGILMVLVSITRLQAGSRFSGKSNTEQQSIEANSNTDESAEAKKLSVWSIIRMTDWLFWPFVMITAVGILLITYRTLFEHRQKKQSHTLLQSHISRKSFRGLVRAAHSSNPTRASRLMYQMIATFEKTRRAEPIGDDINQFLSAERDSFETFNRVNGFLSESAGALGLLGTVWGIFQTFHAGKLDGPTILQGMSISLVTTLVGLIISLVLNMGGTYVFTLFNGQLNLLANKAEELRQVLLYIEKKPVDRIKTVNRGYNDFRIPKFNQQPDEQSYDKFSDEIAFSDM